MTSVKREEKPATSQPPWYGGQEPGSKQSHCRRIATTGDEDKSKSNPNEASTLEICLKPPASCTNGIRHTSSTNSSGPKTPIVSLLNHIDKGVETLEQQCHHTLAHQIYTSVTHGPRLSMANWTRMTLTTI
ncbi:hypothetical protein L484_008066 [Morus notabilis]|uniref:Uncharacterized protein n=1 Tax=Morus notabilis TaxID=981085 RepID=W9R338_9ROSA|nr:hypothetical protein L484_008066 [Morus notabilis]